MPAPPPHPRGKGHVTGPGPCSEAQRLSLATCPEEREGEHAYAYGQRQIPDRHLHSRRLRGVEHMIANIAVAIAGDVEVNRARVALDARGIDLDRGRRDTARENLGIRCQ